MGFETLNGRVRPTREDGGEVYKDLITIGTRDFQKTGAFAPQAGRFVSTENDTTGKLVLGNGGEDSTFAGVAIRDTTGSLEVNPSEGYDETVTNIQYLRTGLITVFAVAGQAAPLQWAKVRMVVADGKATKLSTANTTEATNATFVKEVKAGVWLVHLA